MVKIVARRRDGGVLKGTTSDFAPARNSFHLKLLNDGSIIEVALEDLKAVFFVKDFVGNPDHIDSKDFSKASGFGKQIIVEFADGERFYGLSGAIHRNRTGFFVSPADPKANTIRAFVINSYITGVEAP